MVIRLEHWVFGVLGAHGAPSRSALLPLVFDSSRIS